MNLDVKGFLVTICGFTQIGKDYIAKLIQEKIEEKIVLNCYTKRDALVREKLKNAVLDESPIYQRLSQVKIVHPQIYKVRKQRKNDDENVHCVDSEEQIPKEFDLRYKIYGTQTTAYSSCEISKLLQDGNIVILPTGSVEISKRLKEKFGENCLSVKVSGAYNTEEMIAEREAKRLGVNPDSPEVEEFAKNRYEDIQRLVKELIDYESDFTLRNWWTYPGGKYLATGPHDISKPVDTIANHAYCGVLSNIEMSHSEILSKVNKEGPNLDK